MKKISKIIIIFVVGFILIGLSIYFGLDEKKTYIKINDIKINDFSDSFNMKGLLYEYTTTGVNYKYSQPVNVEYSINSVKIEDSSKENYQKIIVDYNITTNGNIMKLESTKLYTPHPYFNTMEVYDAYTGKVLNMKGFKENNSSNSNSMTINFDEKEYVIYQETTVKWSYLSTIEVTEQTAYYPIKMHVTDVIEIPKDYEGLLIGFNSLNKMNESEVKAKQELETKEYYILDVYNNNTKIFKVKEYSK